MKENSLKTVARNSSTCPTKSMIQSSKCFSPKALQLEYQLLWTATDLIHVDFTKNLAEKKRTFQVACCRCLHALICAKARDTEQFSHLSCLHSRAATFTSDLSSQHQTQWLMHSGAEKLKYQQSVVEGWVKDDPVTLVACSKGLSHGNYKRTLEIYRVTRETSSGVNRPIAMEWNRTILGKKY